MSQEIELLHIPFRAELDKLRGEVCYTYHRPDKPTGGTIGDADFIIYGTGSRVLMCEFKDKGTKISDGQKARHAELAAIGIRVHIVRDLSIALELLRAFRSTLGEVAPVDAPRRETTIYGGRRWDLEGNNLVNPRTI